MIGLAPLLNSNVIIQRPRYARTSLSVRAHQPKVNLAHLAVNPQRIARTVPGLRSV